MMAEPALLASVLKPDHENVRLAWQKALVRRETDPEGAITSAEQRTATRS
jgi:hypothetical protein